MYIFGYITKTEIAIFCIFTYNYHISEKLCRCAEYCAPTLLYVPGDVKLGGDLS